MLLCSVPVSETRRESGDWTPLWKHRRKEGYVCGSMSRFEGCRLTPVTLSAITPNPILPIADDTLNSVLYSAPWAAVNPTACAIPSAASLPYPQALSAHLCPTPLTPEQEWRDRRTILRDKVRRNKERITGDEDSHEDSDESGRPKDWLGRASREAARVEAGRGLGDGALAEEECNGLVGCQHDILEIARMTVE